MFSGAKNFNLFFIKTFGRETSVANVYSDKNKDFGLNFYFQKLLYSNSEKAYMTLW